MKQYNVKIEKGAEGKEVLPAGAYVAKIVSARVDENSYGSSLVIAFDIAEGQFKDFFKKDFDNNPREDKKWRGVYRIFLPKDDGSEKDEWTKRTLGNALYAIEDSNNGYKWAWEESTLKGKSVGVAYRNKEWEYNGNRGWTTECGKLVSVEDVRNGKVKPLKDRPLKNAPATSATNTSADAFADVKDEELPF